MESRYHRSSSPRRAYNPARSSTGTFADPSYDYSTYRLVRPGYGYQRYIRYGNDVVLVDTRNGRAVQVYNSFFY